MGYSSGGDGVGREGTAPVAEGERQAVEKVLGDMEWWEGDVNPLGVQDSLGKQRCQAWSLRLGNAVEHRDGDKGFVEVSCVHTMAPDPVPHPQPGWHGRTLSPGYRAKGLRAV